MSHILDARSFQRFCPYQLPYARVNAIQVPQDEFGRDCARSHPSDFSFQAGQYPIKMRFEIGQDMICVSRGSVAGMKGRGRTTDYRGAWYQGLETGGG